MGCNSAPFKLCNSGRNNVSILLILIVSTCPLVSEYCFVYFWCRKTWCIWLQDLIIVMNYLVVVLQMQLLEFLQGLENWPTWHQFYYSYTVKYCINYTSDHLLSIKWFTLQPITLFTITILLASDSTKNN